MDFLALGQKAMSLRDKSRHLEAVAVLKDALLPHTYGGTIGDRLYAQFLLADSLGKVGRLCEGMELLSEVHNRSRALRYYELAYDSFETYIDLARIVHESGGAANPQDVEDRLTLIDRGLQWLHEIGKPAWRHALLLHKALALLSIDDCHEARRCAAEAYSLVKVSGSTQRGYGVVSYAITLIKCERLRGDYDAAFALFRELDDCAMSSLGKLRLRTEWIRLSREARSTDGAAVYEAAKQLAESSREVQAVRDVLVCHIEVAHCAVLAELYADAARAVDTIQDIAQHSARDQRVWLLWKADRGFRSIASALEGNMASRARQLAERLKGCIETMKQELNRVPPTDKGEHAEAAAGVSHVQSGRLRLDLLHVPETGGSSSPALSGNDLRSQPIVNALRSLSIEVDQKLRSALSLCTPSLFVRDDELFLALWKLNTIATRCVPFDLSEHCTRLPGADGPPGDPEHARFPTPPHSSTRELMAYAIRRRTSSNTFSSADFLRAVADASLSEGDSVMRRPATVDLLMHSAGCPNPMGRKLADEPQAMGVLQALRHAVMEEDYQYVLAAEQNRIVVRIASVLDDYVQRTDSGLLVPERAILLLKEQYACVTRDELEELEALLNSERTKEGDFQAFFEEHPHFLRQWDYREVYPHVMLKRPEGGLVPDFILTNRDMSRACILELKTPHATIIRRQENRDRFTSCVMEARSQLLRYRDWFSDHNNRSQLERHVGMSIYQPQLITIIGRSREFFDDVDRQRLASDQQDMQVVTYDDIVALARRRMMIIGGR